MEYLGYENDFTKQELINQKCQEAEKNGWKVKEEKEDANTYVYTLGVQGSGRVAFRQRI
jgi:hypothetical protein